MFGCRSAGGQLELPASNSDILWDCVAITFRSDALT